MARTTRPADAVRQSPPASTVAASTFVHTVGRFDTRPSRSSVANESGRRTTIVIGNLDPSVRRGGDNASRSVEHSGKSNYFRREIVTRSAPYVRDVSNHRHPGGRIVAAPSRPAHAAPERLGARRRVAAARHHHAGGDLPGAGD